MAKKLIKKSTINKISRLLFSRHKKPSSRSSMGKKIVKKVSPRVEYPIVYIESGSKVIFSPEGTEYAQDKLKSIYDPDEKAQWFSITPVCQYQIDNEWPDVEKFVNVNILGSIETEKDNWLGYIGAWEDDENQTFVVDHLLKILKDKRPLLKGKLVKETSGEYRIIFFVSRTSLEEVTSSH